MNLQEFEKEFARLGKNPKAAVVDKYNRLLIKQRMDVSFLKPVIAGHEEYYRTYFQVSIATRATLNDKFTFLEDNFDLLRDWWHVDILMGYLGDGLDFDYAYQKAQKYVTSRLPYVRRFGYVLFIPRLVKEKKNLNKLFGLLKNEEVYHVVMAEAWLISFLAMCDANVTYDYLKHCELKYNIVGKAIQKICDSFVISPTDKARFKSLRSERKLKG